MICTVRAAISPLHMERSAPVVFMFMNARAAKVDGKIYENCFQSHGKLLCGQENPVRNRHIGDIIRKITITVSRCLIKVLNVKLKTTQAVT